MTGSVTAKANGASEALEAWLRDLAAPRPGSGAPETEDATAADPSRSGVAPSAPPAGPGLSLPGITASDALLVAAACTTGSGHRSTHVGAPLRLAHTDWLHHQLTVTGPVDHVAEFREAAAGSGSIPWQLDLDRIEEDCFHRLVAPPVPQRRTLSLAGARILARQLRDAVARRHELAVRCVGHSRACPFDLHALVPVPGAVLRLGLDDPAALAWLWRHWGTTEALRHVAEAVSSGEGRAGRSGEGQGAFHVTCWSADWTPWRALATIAAGWPTLRFDIRPTYGTA